MCGKISFQGILSILNYLGIAEKQHHLSINNFLGGRVDSFHKVFILVIFSFVSDKEMNRSEWFLVMRNSCELLVSGRSAPTTGDSDPVGLGLSLGICFKFHSRF